MTPPQSAGFEGHSRQRDSALGAEPTPAESAPPADEDTRAEDSPNNVMLTVGLVSLVIIAVVVIAFWRIRQKGDAT
jgi:heme/copper-type cytochrome/quinol oxidase subunit 2